MAERRVVEITGLDEMAKAFGRLRKHAFGDAVQEALDDVAETAVGGVAREFDEHIEGGPVPFTRVRPGSRQSSVVSSRKRGATKGEASSSVSVQKRQSAYLKYALAEDGQRDPGDVGAADKYNFLPIPGELAGKQGISLTPQGNLPKNTIRTLIRRAMSQRARDHAKLKKKAKDGAVSKADFDAMRIKRKKRLGLARKDQFLGDHRAGDRNDIWFGRRKREGGTLGRTVGFWQRPENRKGAPRLLIAALPKSRYRDRTLVDGWNDAMEDAAASLPREMERRLALILDRMQTARRARRRR